MTLHFPSSRVALKEEVLLPKFPESVEHVKFWEDTCSNRGLNVRIFDNRQHALDWLIE